MIGTLNCALHLSSTRVRETNLTLWTPSDPLCQMVTLNFDPVTCQFECNFKSQPNPDPEKYITLIVEFSRKYGIQKLPEDEDDVGRCILFSRYSKATELGIDGKEVLLMVRNQHAVQVAFEWQMVCQYIPCSWNGDSMTLTWKASQLVNHVTSPEFLPLNERYKSQADGDWSVSLPLHATLLMPREVNWIHHPRLFSQLYLEDLIYQTQFVFGNKPFNQVNLVKFMSRLCSIQAEFIKQSSVLSRHVREFYANPATCNEAICVGYHIYLSILLLFPESELIQSLKRAIINIGLPVVAFGLRNEVPFVTILVIPATMLTQLFYPKTPPNRWDICLEERLGNNIELHGNGNIQVLHELPADTTTCIFKTIVSDIHEHLFHQTGPHMFTIWHEGCLGLNYFDDICPSLMFDAVIPHARLELEWYEAQYCPHTPPLLTAEKTWSTHVCKEVMYETFKTVDELEIEKLREELQEAQGGIWKTETGQFGAGFAVRFYPSTQNWFGRHYE